jgi:hypothetical protein
MIKNLSYKTLLVCYLFITVTAFWYYPRWEQSRTEATIGWDVSGYYMYLPAFFIYQDPLQCSFRDSVIAKYYPTPDFHQAFRHEKSGNFVMKYASGQALMMSPFFFVGHIWAQQSGVYPADGFSFPYQAAIGIGMFLYAFLGLFMLRKVLLAFFSDRTVAITLVAFVFGSNYLNYSSIDQGMTHSPLFTVYTLLLYAVIQFYKKPGIGSALSIGALCGLATLTRPSEIVSLILPLAWGIVRWSDVKHRGRFLVQHSGLIIAAAFLFIMVAGIQLVYWKYATGEWFVFSYQDQGFNWLHPHGLDFMFSYKCGWLVYSPMLLFAFIGIPAFFMRRENTWAILGFFLFNFYVVSAWSMWDYGGTAGRAMVQSYPILAFLVAALVEQVHRKKWRLWLFYPFFLLFLYVNIWWTHNAHRGEVTILGVTNRYYWRVIGKWSLSEADKKLLDNKYSYDGEPATFEVLYENNFETDSSKNVIVLPEGKKIQIGGPYEFTQEYIIPRSAAFKKWVRVFADIHCHDKEWDVWRQTQFVLRFYDKDQVAQTNFLRVQRYFETGEHRIFYLDAKLPRKDWDRIGIHFWNPGTDKLLSIDNLKVITFDL